MTFPFLRHVQVSNDEAISFYQKFGFEIVGQKDSYYKRIDPPDAYILQKNLKPAAIPAAETTEVTVTTDK